MVFSSSLFIFGFLPIFFICYFISPARVKNYTLLLFSLLFYAWGEPAFVIVMIAVSLIDYISAMLIDRAKSKRLGRALLCLTVVINLAILVYYKYTNLFIHTAENIFNVTFNFTDIVLPIGISFFTFQAMSYVIDVYRGDVSVQKNPFTVMLYISLFPQLIAGPIVRYQTIEAEILCRRHTVDNVCKGLERFICGFMKKVIIANNMASLADVILQSEVSSTSLLLLGAVSYMLQIYFDFSAYSDMAIGLGLIMGFHFEENFDYPYTSISITEFWRKWHISLSSWFRDYVYIPLGGNKKGVPRQIFNLFAVWALTGLWHGASWNFLLWGLYYFVLLILEKLVLSAILQKVPKLIRYILSMLMVLVGWIIFYYESIADIANALRLLIIPSFSSDDVSQLTVYLSSYGVFLALGIILSFPVYKKLKSFVENKNSLIVNVIWTAGHIAVAFISVCFLVQSTYNPFIYFRF